ncbi:ste/ste11/bck1 protein kinase [Fusarium flagelliforme]|uniref:Ste/ste11/bck1 protein kinase n=1 Tax=Fusarium flagelliforme TaxID=2675880 RepID=A0A395MIS5_9HYPO|nr:ste/ste11/bck1 protein kinase [Fusarium flagelliforme]
MTTPTDNPNAKSQFLRDWQEILNAPNIHGTQSLEPRAYRSCGNSNQQVYPKLTRGCTDSGTSWGQPREREEGKRMRRLIRSIVTGRFDYADLPDDQKLVIAKQIKGDSVGTLKFFVTPPAVPAMTCGLTANPNAPASLGYLAHGLDDSKLNPRQQSSTSPLTSKSNTSTDSKIDKNALSQEATSYPVEMKIKQRECLEMRKHAAGNGSPLKSADSGITSNGVVDFDQPRSSPYNNKRPDQLSPQRPPPALPATLFSTY